MDLSALLVRVLHDVLEENDTGRRRAAIDELFHQDAQFGEFGAGVFRGRAEIDAFVGRFRASHPDFRYQLLGEPEVVGNGGRVRWVAGPAGGPPAAAGADFIVVREGRILAIYLFFDPPPLVRGIADAADARSQ